MALSKIDNVKFESLSQTLSMLLKHGTDLELAKTMLADQIGEFEVSSNHIVKFVTQEDDSVVLEALNLSKDFVRTRKPNDETQVLRAKIQGVGIDVKLFKEGDYEFSNEEAISALRALADEVEGVSVELSTLGNSDVRKDLAGASNDDSEQNLGESDDLEPSDPEDAKLEDEDDAVLDDDVDITESTDSEGE